MIIGLEDVTDRPAIIKTVGVTFFDLARTVRPPLPVEVRRRLPYLEGLV